jgi:predicted alpha/beta superfamily hydrolase
VFATATVYPWFSSTAGSYSVVTSSLFAPTLANTRPIVVYVPPSYAENPYKRYGRVLVMHDGQNLFNASTSAFGVAWDCQATVDALVVEGAMDEIVIVGVYNEDANRTYEYTYSECNAMPDCQGTQGVGGGADAYLDFLETTVYPYVANRFRVVPHAPWSARWGMLGSSLGGLLSCYAGWTRPHAYDRVGCMSSSFWWNGQDFNHTVLGRVAPAPLPNVTFYLDSGNAGPDQDDEVETLTVLGHLESDGYSLNSTLWYYLQQGGQHSEYFWGLRFFVPMTELYAPLPVAVAPLTLANYLQ